MKTIADVPVQVQNLFMLVCTIAVWMLVIIAGIVLAVEVFRLVRLLRRPG